MSRPSFTTTAEAAEFLHANELTIFGILHPRTLPELQSRQSVADTIGGTGCVGGGSQTTTTTSRVTVATDVGAVSEGASGRSIAELVEEDAKQTVQICGVSRAG